LELKRTLNFALQNDINRETGIGYFDLENYEEEETDRLPSTSDLANAIIPKIDD
jgi:hypothetical protein